MNYIGVHRTTIGNILADGCNTSGPQHDVTFRNFKLNVDSFERMWEPDGLVVNVYLID